MDHLLPVVRSFWVNGLLTLPVQIHFGVLCNVSILCLWCLLLCFVVTRFPSVTARKFCQPSGWQNSFWKRNIWKLFWTFLTVTGLLVRDSLYLVGILLKFIRYSLKDVKNQVHRVILPRHVILTAKKAEIFGNFGNFGNSSELFWPLLGWYRPWLTIFRWYFAKIHPLLT